MAETIFSFVIFIISVIYLFETRDLNFGTLTRPGVGFFPAIAGSGAAILSLIIFLTGLKRQVQKKSPAIDWKKIVLYLIGLIIYVPAVQIFGYAVVTFLLMMYLLKVSGTKGWVVPVIISAMISYGIYYAFTNLLGVPLP